MTGNVATQNLNPMEFDIDAYMATLPEGKRVLFREQMKHSFSWYGLDGEYLRTGFHKEDLLSVLMKMERFMVDTNFPWQNEAKKSENENKAFIIGQTVSDEQDDLWGVYFGPSVDITNNNLFDFGMEKFRGVPFLTIRRLDPHFRLILNKQGMKEESRPRAKRTGPEFLERERKHMADVAGMKQSILSVLAVPDLASLPPAPYTERKKAQIIGIIRAKAPLSLKKYWNAVEVACLCYSALLLEQDSVGDKTRNEFEDPTRRNVFGDTRLVQNALWLKSRILSRDNAVKRMVEYIGMPEITVRDTA